MEQGVGRGNDIAGACLLSQSALACTHSRGLNADLFARKFLFVHGGCTVTVPTVPLLSAHHHLNEHITHIYNVRLAFGLISDVWIDNTTNGVKHHQSVSSAHQ